MKFDLNVSIKVRFIAVTGAFNLKSKVIRVFF